MGFTDIREVHSPLDPRMILTARQDEKELQEESRFPYARIVGKLMFLAGMTQPEISRGVLEFNRRIS